MLTELETEVLGDGELETELLMLVDGEGELERELLILLLIEVDTELDLEVLGDGELEGEELREELGLALGDDDMLLFGGISYVLDA